MVDRREEGDGEYAESIGLFCRAVCVLSFFSLFPFAFWAAVGRCIGVDGVAPGVLSGVCLRGYEIAEKAVASHVFGGGIAELRLDTLLATRFYHLDSY